MKVSQGVGLFLAAAILSTGGCSSSPNADNRASAKAGSDVASSPWPSDVFLQNGHLQVGGLAFDGAKDSALRDLEGALDELDGAPLKTSVFFPIEGGSVPDGALDGSAHVIDLTSEEPDPPVDMPLFHRTSTNEIVALTPAGHAFREGHRYGCTVDDRWVKPSADLANALAGKGPLASIYAPLVTALGNVSHVGAATVFTVGHPASVLLALVDQAGALPAPGAAVDRAVVGTAALDDFFGAPTTDREGLGDPGGIKHDAIGSVILGHFAAPYFLTNGPDHLGRIEKDDAGQFKVQDTTQIPFFLALPRDSGAGLANVPVMIFQHGLNASRGQVAAVANDFARAGYATIGIDALWHGDRRPGHVDSIHNFSGKAGADGLADDDPFGASLLFFDFNGDDAVSVDSLDARVARDNFREAVTEVTELVRLLVEGNTTPIAASDPSLATLTLDASHLVYTSESFGSILGAMTIAVDPRLKSAILSVGGAGIFLPTFADSPYFAKLASIFFKPNLDSALDVSDPSTLPAEAQRSLALMQAVIEPGDPVAFAPLVARRPARFAKSLVLLQAFSDELIPNQSGEFLAAQAGATTITIPNHTQPVRYVTTLPTSGAPLSGNLNGATVGHVNVDPATHLMFTRFHDQRIYQPGFPPLTPLATPLDIDEPIEWLHALAIAFANDARTTQSAPTLTAP